MSAVIELGWADLAVAAGLVLLLAVLSFRWRLGMHGAVLVAAGRSVVQLLLVGLVLEEVFELEGPLWVGLLAVVMLGAAGFEVRARQRRRFRGGWSYGLGTTAMFLSSFAVTSLALTAVIGPDPWYTPQYSIPLLGMLLGNTMTGVSLCLDRLLTGAWEQRDVIEQRLLLGHSRARAIADLKRESLRAGLIPIVNSMAAAGLVSLPGMMTGQILAGSEPTVAARYQILILFLIAGGTGLGVLAAIHLATRRLFDERHRLRLDRLSA